MSECTAVGCAKELSDGITLCHRHTTRLEEALREVPGVWVDIHTTACKLDVGAGSVGGLGGKAESVAPANLEALDTADTLRHILRGWAGHLPPMISGDPSRHAGYLLGRINLIRRADWAGDLLEELRDALNACARATDRAGLKVFAGMCPTVDDDRVECSTPLYALPERPHSQCPKCKAEWDVSSWRTEALQAAELHTGTAAEISRMLSDPVTGEALPQGTIWSWTSRGKITPSGINERGKPIYTVSEVRDMWAKMQASSYNRHRNAA